MLSDEEKILTKKLRYCEQEYEQNGYLSVGKFEAIKEAVNLIEKQSKEIEEYKKQLDLDTQKDKLIDEIILYIIRHNYFDTTEFDKNIIPTIENIRKHFEERCK